VCLTFNGEIYNYQELRQELTERGLAFRTGSDTEVLLNGYLAWGDGVLERLNGFFALALYDARKPGVMLARDRLGKAHLYLRRDGGRGVYWASEIKALRAASCIGATDIDVAAVSEFIVSAGGTEGGPSGRTLRTSPCAFRLVCGGRRLGAASLLGLPADPLGGCRHFSPTGVGKTC